MIYVLMAMLVDASCGLVSYFRSQSTGQKA